MWLFSGNAHFLKKKKMAANCENLLLRNRALISEL